MNQNETINKDEVIKKMLKRIEKVQKYSANMSYEDFQKNEVVIEACTFNLYQIGELAKESQLDGRVQGQIYVLHSNIMYAGEIRIGIVWKIIREGLPDLRDYLIKETEKVTTGSSDWDVKVGKMYEECHIYASEKLFEFVQAAYVAMGIYESGKISPHEYSELIEALFSYLVETCNPATISVKFEVQRKPLDVECPLIGYSKKRLIAAVQETGDVDLIKALENRVL